MIRERRFDWTVYDPSVLLLGGLMKKDLSKTRQDINNFVIEELEKNKTAKKKAYFVTLNFPLALIPGNNSQETINNYLQPLFLIEIFEHLDRNQIKAVHISPIIDLREIGKFNRKVVDLYHLHLKVKQSTPQFKDLDQ